MKLRRPPQGFTLIELLVVISIIAILASFAVPAVTGALVKGQLVGSLNNARNIFSSGMQMALDGSTNGDSSLGWPGDLKDNSVITDLPGYVTKLVTNDYLKPADLKIFSAPGVLVYPGGSVTGSGTNASLSTPFEDKYCAFKVYLVRENDPSNTLFLATKNYTYNTAITDTTLKPYGDKGFIVIRKGGDALMLKKQQAASSSIVTIVGNVPLPSSQTDLSQAGTESADNCFQTKQQ